ncbi:MAG: carbamoyltransferase HypF [Bacteriovoracaceae bacterium]|nr:carbamoyltransferase HypF [Bacteriovoracaceae bacterium]
MKSTNVMHCLNIKLKGLVQGVGMRPALYRQAQKFNLIGSIENNHIGSELELFGEKEILNSFLKDLEKCFPKSSHVTEKIITWSSKECLHSELQFKKSTSKKEAKEYSIPVDLSTCKKCWSEFKDPGNRRYLYPFITCCDCGPRWSILKDLPFERNDTSMVSFPMCSQCKNEYENPNDRRFFAQTISCNDCGPKASMNFKQVQELLLSGKVGAIKSIGGYALICDATNKMAIERVRKIKNRPSKPLGIMTRDKKSFNSLSTSGVEWEDLNTPASPMIISKYNNTLATQHSLAPYNQNIGVMAPPSPFHYLLFGELNHLVFTSANRSNFPLIYENNKLEEQLNADLDFILDHSRTIERPIDDSVLSTSGSIIRKARGLAPQVYKVKNYQDENVIIASGSDLKSSFAILNGENIFQSSFLGDLENAKTLERYEKEIDKTLDLLNLTSEKSLCDKHPKWLSRNYALSYKECIEIQHHKAHSMAAAFEHSESNCYIFACDGTGFGDDGNIWGGECFHYKNGNLNRVASFEKFNVPAGSVGHRSPRILFDMMMNYKVDGLKTNSVGRWFDAMAWYCFPDQLESLSYEAQAPEFLESKSVEATTSWPTLVFNEDNDGKLIIPLLEISDLIIKSDYPPENKAWLFHDGLAEVIIQYLDHIACDEHIIFTGGVFHNALLTERLKSKNEFRNFNLLFPEGIPCGDSHISLGQILYFLKGGRDA